MKGMVFTEFLEMVETHHSPAVADRIIRAAHTRTDGAYTTVGTYDHAELVRMVTALAQETATPVAELMRGFGHHMAVRFAALFSHFFAEQRTLFDFLSSVDSVVHVEVLKLYPDAELPSFDVLERSDDRISLIYRSTRHMSDLALGLIEGAAAHYGETIALAHRADDDGSVLIHIERVRHACPA